MFASTFGLFFFFQAEDSIRAKLVTGVQTCALPIPAPPAPAPAQAEPVKTAPAPVVADAPKPAPEVKKAEPVKPKAKAAPPPSPPAPSLLDERSEERRVGKECISRWPPYDETTKEHS